MDLNPINVLADSKAAPSSANTRSARQSFADVLSGQPQSVDHTSSASKTTAPQSDRENKPPRKEKSNEGRTPDQNQLAVDSTAPANPAPAPPTADALVLDLSGLTAPAKTEPGSDTSNSFAELSAKSATLASVAASASPNETTTSRPIPQDKTPHPASSRSVPQPATGAQPSELSAGKSLPAPDATPVRPAEKPEASQDAMPTHTQQDGIKHPAVSPIPSLVAPAVATAPATPEIAHSKPPVSGDEPPKNAIADLPDANSAQALGDLTAAAEKIGAVMSATVNSTTPKTPAARPKIDALKAAIAPGKIGASNASQISESSAPRIDDDNRRSGTSEKREPGPTPFDQNATTDSKAVADQLPKEPIPATTTPGKDGAGSALTGAGQQIPAQALKNGTPAWPAGSTAPQASSQQDAATVALNRANVAAGMELSGLSKTSLIERFHQSELHFGMQSGEFGHIEVRTLLDHHEVTARISVERGDLSRALESELPGLQKRLGDLDVPTARITLHEQSAAMSGESGRRSRGQEWPTGHSFQASEPERQPLAAALLEPPTLSEGLSIRI